MTPPPILILCLNLLLILPNIRASGIHLKSAYQTFGPGFLQNEIFSTCSITLGRISACYAETRRCSQPDDGLIRMLHQQPLSGPLVLFFEPVVINSESVKQEMLISSGFRLPIMAVRKLEIKPVKTYRGCDVQIFIANRQEFASSLKLVRLRMLELEYFLSLFRIHLRNPSILVVIGQYDSSQDIRNELANSDWTWHLTTSMVIVSDFELKTQFLACYACSGEDSLDRSVPLETSNISLEGLDRLHKSGMQDLKKEGIEFQGGPAPPGKCISASDRFITDSINSQECTVAEVGRNLNVTLVMAGDQHWNKALLSSIALNTHADIIGHGLRSSGRLAATAVQSVNHVIWIPVGTDSTYFCYTLVHRIGTTSAAAFWNPFDLTTWLFTLGTVILVTAFSLWIFKGLDGACTFGCLLLAQGVQPLSILRELAVFRLAWSIWALLVIVLSGAYQGTVTSFLALPTIPTAPDGIDELVAYPGSVVFLGERVTISQTFNKVNYSRAWSPVHLQLEDLLYDPDPETYNVSSLELLSKNLIVVMSPLEQFLIHQTTEVPLAAQKYRKPGITWAERLADQKPAKEWEQVLDGDFVFMGMCDEVSDFEMMLRSCDVPKGTRRGEHDMRIPLMSLLKPILVSRNAFGGIIADKIFRLFQAGFYDLWAKRWDRIVTVRGIRRLRNQTLELVLKETSGYKNGSDMQDHPLSNVIKKRNDLVHLFNDYHSISSVNLKVESVPVLLKFESLKLVFVGLIMLLTVSSLVYVMEIILVLLF